MLIIRRNEDALIDDMSPQTDNSSPLVTHADDPGERLQNVGGVKLPELPDPTVGGENGSGKRNGFSTGFRSFASRFARFDGRMQKLPSIQNAVQGEVGQGNRAASLYAGVMNQTVSYRADSSTLARSITGVG